MSYINQNVNSPTYIGKYQTIKDYILLSLGWPLIKVELEEQHLNLAIMDAITLWYKKAGAVSYTCAIVYPVGNIAQIPDGVNPVTISDVIFDPNLMDSFSKGLVMAGDDDAFGKYVFPQAGFNNLLSNFDMVSYYLFTQRLEDFKKLVGIDRSWEILNGQIHLYPASATFAQVGVLYRRIPEDAELEAEQWIKEYALAKAKHILGTVRGKMSGFQATGGNFSGDAAELKAEAKEEMLALRTDLDLIQRPMPIGQV